MVKYAYIESLRGVLTIKEMCGWCDVSRSGYYKWRNRKDSVSSLRKSLVTSVVSQTFDTYKSCYGAPRMTVELNETGTSCCVNFVAKIMRELSLKAKNGKNYKYFPSMNAINHVSDNLLARDFTASKPNEKWTSDITYIKLDRGFVYLAVVMDLFSRKIIGWSLDITMTNQLIIDALNMAIASREVEPDLILHSDRGVQYRSSEYQYLLLNEGIKPSMSRKGNCWDNAAMEAFFGRLKVEYIYPDTFKGKSDAYACVFEYIETFYNPIRRHSANDYKSPNNYENEYYEKCA
ncbi:MAG: IS3 family transposase [Methylococcales bacterium]